MSKHKEPQYDEEQVNHWLAWLAKNMQRHDQTVFLIENLQPSWLHMMNEMHSFILATRLIWAVWISLSIWLVFGPNSLSPELPFWQVFGLIMAIPVGLIWGLVDIWRFNRGHSVERTPRLLRSRAIYTMAIGLIFALVFGLIYGLKTGDITTIYSSATLEIKEWAFFSLTIGLIIGLIYGLIVGMVYTSRSMFRTPSTAIRTVETLKWSLEAAMRSGGQGLIIGLAAGLAIGLIGLLIDGSATGVWNYGQTDEVIFGALLGIVLGLILGLIGLALGGFVPTVHNLKVRANQGIWLSFCNAVRMGGIGGLAFGLFVVVASGSINGADIGTRLEFGLSYGLLAVMALYVWFGGFEATDHGILRLILWRKGYAPLNYAEFLDYAADELNFLQKVGGGYIFIHRYLLEYFASMADEPGSHAESTAQSVAVGDD